MTREPTPPEREVEKPEAGEGDAAAGVRRVLQSRHRIHRVSLTLRLLGGLAAAGCLLAGAAAVLVWIRDAIDAAGT